ncbi:ribokinase [uncultured Jatrophihabitans sp.]|uniref:ribokinase n=1 Tax=uncultured Jatrophihabitans sp. TaxID=1610747 RepID=UPI0035CA74B7
MDAAAGRVVVVGSVNVDHVVETDVFPAPGETVAGRSVRTSIGGKGGNQAVAAARLGGPVAMVARIGDDDGGARARAALVAAGVDVSGVVPVEGTPTGTAWITVTPDDNTIVVVAGANAAWPDGWAADGVAPDDVVLSQLEVPLAVVVAAAATPARFVLNAAPAAALPEAVIARCAVLVVNEHEQLVVAGTSGVADAHAVLRSRGAGAVVTTLGAQGAVVTDDHGTRAYAAPPSDVVDTTGAGDAFAGVLCARLAAGAELADAVRWAVAAGSLAVRRRGTHDSYPDAVAIETLLR